MEDIGPVLVLTVILQYIVAYFIFRHLKKKMDAAVAREKRLKKTGERGRRNTPK